MKSKLLIGVVIALATLTVKPVAAAPIPQPSFHTKAPPASQPARLNRASIGGIHASPDRD